MRHVYEEDEVAVVVMVVKHTNVGSENLPGQ
jgi:hypothetical protein